MSEIKIDIQRTGFPVTIGTIELWFDASIENLRNFINVEELAEKKLEEAKEKAKHIHFPAEINEDNIRDVDPKDIDAALNLNNEFVAAQYDILFGDGTFKKIYKQYPDIIALESALEPIGNAISERVQEMEFERTKEVETIKKDYLKKKASKRK